MLNERLADIENQCRIKIMRNQERFAEISMKLERFEKLPANLRFLAALPVQELFKSIAILVPDAIDVFNNIEQAYRKDFLENIFWKQYGYMISENAEPNFSRIMTQITKDC